MGRPGLQGPHVLSGGGRHSGLAVWRCRRFGAELGSTEERVVLLFALLSVGKSDPGPTRPRSTAPSHILSWPGSPGSGTLCSVVALELMTTITSPCPKGAPPPPLASSPGNIRVLRSGHEGSNSGSNSSTGDPPGLPHPEPMAGSAFPSHSCCAVGSTPAGGGRLLPPSAGLAPPRRSESLPWPARQESALREPGRASPGVICNNPIHAGKGRRGREVREGS